MPSSKDSDESEGHARNDINVEILKYLSIGQPNNYTACWVSKVVLLINKFQK